MDILEKIKFLEGKNMWETYNYNNLPSLLVSDGPHGIRRAKNFNASTDFGISYKSTCFPTLSLVSNSFDPKLLRQLGSAIGKEAKNYGVDIVLGPGINIKRSPLCGRNFEYFSEDPLLTGILAKNYISGVEREGSGTSLKHFFANNQENYRYTISSEIDKRAMNEIYLKPFKIALKANPATVMSSYNKVNGVYVNQSKYLNDFLRKECKWDGIVVSDWMAIGNRTKSLIAGNDLAMPYSYGFNYKNLKNNLENEDLINAINTSFNRVLNTYKKYYKPKDKISYKPPKENHEIARKVARQSMVLLKNKDNILPLKKDDNVLFCGGFTKRIRYQGVGSSQINSNILNELFNVVGNYTKNYKILEFYDERNDLINSKLEKEVLDIASSFDKIVMYCGLPAHYESEGFDRKQINIPPNQLKLINKLYKVNQNLILVIITGGVIDLSFINNSKAALLAGLAGESANEAILDNLYKYSPSGRLSETYIKNINDCNTLIPNNNNSVYYKESIYIGYRYYETFNKPYLFPFGYGLSYANFKYSNLDIKKEKDYLLISFKIKNQSNINAKEVIQIYSKNPASSLYKPLRELRYFAKESFKPHEEKKLTYKVPFDNFKYFDVKTNKWELEKGNYIIEVNKNSRDVILSSSIYLNGITPNTVKTSYSNKEYDTSDFEKIVSHKLGKENIIKKRPYDFDSTLNDFSNTWLGKRVTNQIIRMANDLEKSNKEEQFFLKSFKQLPLRFIHQGANGKISLNVSEGILDICNKKVIRGIKKIKKG